MLKWSKANAKTEKLAAVPSLAKYLQNKRKVYSLDLLSGYSCPCAKLCLSKAVPTGDGKYTIKDGKDTKFRCFSASQEVIYPVVRKSREYNFDLLRFSETLGGKYVLLRDSMPKDLGICRIHVAGDFFNQHYFDAWLKLASDNSDRLFYAYTKSLAFWVCRKDRIPPNFVLTASYGGRLDGLIESEKLRYSKVIYSESEANNLPIDHDDSHAADPNLKSQSFALLLHGVQPKGSEASKALKALKGKGSHSRD